MGIEAAIRRRCGYRRVPWASRAGERRSAKKIRHFSEASEPIAWPEYGKLEMREVPKDEYGVCMSFRRKRKHVEGAGG